MLCQICSINPAGIKIAHVINDKKIEINLCKSCAEQKGMGNPLMNLPELFGNFMAEVLGEDIFEKSQKSKNIICTGCGTTWQDFQRFGLLGCDICYQMFDEDLNRVLRRIHGSNHHIGSRPSSQRKKIDASEIEIIKRELQAAIKNEDFELAAELRDMIKDAQMEMAKMENDGILR